MILDREVAMAPLWQERRGRLSPSGIREARLVGNALSCRVNNKLARRARRGCRWLLKAISMVKEKATNRKAW
jgi:hypothetical protein